MELMRSWLKTPTSDAQWRNYIHCTVRPKINSYSQIFRFCHIRQKISDFFDLCLHWVSVLHGWRLSKGCNKQRNILRVKNIIQCMVGYFLNPSPLIIFRHWQLIQNIAPSTTVWHQCDSRIWQWKYVYLVFFAFPFWYRNIFFLKLPWFILRSLK